MVFDLNGLRPHGQRTGCGGDAGHRIVGGRPYGGRTRGTMVRRDAGFIDCGRGAIGGRTGEITETKSKLPALLFRRNQ